VRGHADGGHGREDCGVRASGRVALRWIHGVTCLSLTRSHCHCTVRKDAVLLSGDRRARRIFLQQFPGSFQQGGVIRVLFLRAFLSTLVRPHSHQKDQSSVSYTVEKRYVFSSQWRRTNEFSCSAFPFRVTKAASPVSTQVVS
jgi:hypothetical protein